MVKICTRYNPLLTEYGCWTATNLWSFIRPGFILIQLNQKIAQTNLPTEGFELRYLGLQAVMLPVEPTLLVFKQLVY